MALITVLPTGLSQGYRAIQDGKHSEGTTVGQALDALNRSAPEETTIVLVQPQQPDQWFTAEQRQRLESLMATWRLARDGGDSLSAADQAELDGLIELEIKAAGQRAAAQLLKLQP